MEQATALEPHRWTREEYDRMVDVGLLGKHTPVELLQGLIVEMSPQGRRHITMIQELTGVLAPVAAIRRLIVQSPLAATEDSAPEPDLAIVAPAVLAIEVVVTQHKAARVKAAIYAAAGVDEYWIVDVPGRHVDVFTGPAPEGYADHRTFRDEDTLVIEEFGITTTVAGLFDRAERL